MKEAFKDALRNQIARARKYGREHAVEIVVYTGLTVMCVAYSYATAKWIYNKGGLETVNKLLSDGTLVWSDGHPVVVKGELISGSIPWEGPAYLNGIYRVSSVSAAPLVDGVREVSVKLL